MAYKEAEQDAGQIRAGMQNAQEAAARVQSAQKMRAPERRELPRISLEAHSPINTISIVADHSRIPSDGFYPEAHRADLYARIAVNAQRYLPEGVSSLHARFQAALERL